MIDSHCHLTDPRLGDQLEAVLARAADAGVTRVVTIGTDIDDDRAAIAVCRGRDNLRCSIGIHPNHVKDGDPDRVPLLRDLQKDPAVVALGEMGLDYFHKFSPRDLQAEVFEAQLDLARELDRPVVIHSREAIDDTLAILKNAPPVRAVFHCFTGTRDEARRILDAGHLLGFTGPVTYKKSDELREVAAFTPLDRMLVETDGPYLSPEPVRASKINEPAFVAHTAAAIAKAKGIPLTDLDRATTQTTQRFYDWPPASPPATGN